MNPRRESAAPARRTAKQLAGDGAEEQAARHLAEHGLAIVARNYRTRLGEIDLVAREGETLVFVEVRQRASAHFGGAAASIDHRKRAADSMRAPVPLSPRAGAALPLRRRRRGRRPRRMDTRGVRGGARLSAKRR